MVRKSARSGLEQSKIAARLKSGTLKIADIDSPGSDICTPLLPTEAISLAKQMGKLRLSRMAASERVLISAERIQKRVAEMAAEIEADYPVGPLYLISILKGSFIFVADLARAFKSLPVRIEFMAISSYASGKTSSGQVKVTRDLDVPVEGHHILIVEDIIDSGVTLSYLTQLLESRRPQSLAIATLLDKPDRRLKSVEVKYIGFEIPDEFVVGYGLDYAEDYRNLSDICVLSNDYIEAFGGGNSRALHSELNPPRP